MRGSTRLLAAAAMVIVASGCAVAQKAPGRAEKVASTLTELDQDLQSAQRQVQTSIDALSALTTAQESERATRYSTLANEIKKTERSYKSTRKHALRARSQRERYLKQWDKDSAQIQNESLRQVNEARRAELEPIISRVRDSLAAAETAFAPFIEGLQDVKLFLGNNLTTTGIATVEAMELETKRHGAVVTSELTRAADAVRDLAQKLRPGGA